MSDSPTQDITLEGSSSDLSVCDREPIRWPGSIQPNGYLLVLAESDLSILQASANIVELFGHAAQDCLGMPLRTLLGEFGGEMVQRGQRQRIDDNPTLLGTFRHAEDAERAYTLLLHRRNGVLLLELEPVLRAYTDFNSIYSRVRAFVNKLEDESTVDALCRMAVGEVRAVCGYGRVMIYRFDEEGHGQVIAEDRDAEYRSYLGQRFPASDVPRQARELYLAHRIRQIADVDYAPVPIVPGRVPGSETPTDLSYCGLRSVSPVHLEYMRNMGTAASMSISIVVGQKLWGMVSCHHRAPRAADLEARIACEHIGQMLSLQIESKEHGAESDHRFALRGTLVHLISRMADNDDFVAGLMSAPKDLLDFMAGHGVAISIDGRVAMVGETPSQAAIEQIVEHIVRSTTQDVFHTECLSASMPSAERLKHVASGVLAVRISKLHRNMILWFRPEVVRTVEWAGDPRKVASRQDGRQIRLSPRKSFDVWCEVMRGRSTPWRPAEISMAEEFRNAALGIVLKRAEEMASLAAELGRANKELEAFSYSVSHDLRAPLRHIAGYGDLLFEYEAEYLSDRGKRFLKNITDSARLAGTLVDDLLTFSQMGRAALRVAQVPLGELVANVVREVSLAPGREVVWRIGALPSVAGDAAFLLLAMRNLIANAVKYTQQRAHAVIEIGTLSDTDKDHVIFVRDNGVGFDMKYVGKLFGVFQRLHRFEDFEGTGIGLANVRRIVERHGGRVWAEGEVDRGATFYIALPKQPDAAAADTATAH